jgi:hypothetical protein
MPAASLSTVEAVLSAHCRLQGLYHSFGEKARLMSFCVWHAGCTVEALCGKM